MLNLRSEKKTNFQSAKGGFKCTECSFEGTCAIMHTYSSEGHSRYLSLNYSKNQRKIVLLEIESFNDVFHFNINSRYNVKRETESL